MFDLYNKISCHQQKINLFSMILVMVLSLLVVVPSYAKPKVKKQTTEEVKKIEENIASSQQPTIEELSAANQELLTQNAKLQREVNELETQVNVLMAERSGQLFLYGAFTVIIGAAVGIFAAWLLIKRRKNW